MKIQQLAIRKIFDSRGQATIEMELTSESGRIFQGSVPSGKSRGSNEAVVLEYAQAETVVAVIQKQIQNRNFSSVQELDDFLKKLDGTNNKSKLGGNVLLGISIAFARAMADFKRQSVEVYLNREFFGSQTFLGKPIIFSNLINGGEHAQNNLAIQEYMVVARSSHSFSETVGKLTAFYKKLGEVLKKRYKVKNLPIGDEGGYSLDFTDNFEPIKILETLLQKENLNQEWSIGLDCAASSFYKKGKYQFGGKLLTSNQLVAIYVSYAKKSNLLVSLEDPFAEKDYEGFRLLMSQVKNKLIVGDDLTTTNVSLIEQYAKDQLINGVIIKPNQIGTVSETCDAIRKAKNHNIKTIISHRSGETEDSFIIQLAKASGAHGVKIGAPIKERLIKFNELIRIYDSE